MEDLQSSETVQYGTVIVNTCTVCQIMQNLNLYYHVSVLAHQLLEMYLTNARC